MNIKYLVGLVIAGLVAVGSVIYAVSTQQAYLTFEQAREDGGSVQVKGTWVKSSPAEYDEAENLFTFSMIDEEGTEMPIEYHGPKPNNFEMAEEVVVGGRYVDGEFAASSLLTKCPSKYEADSIEVPPAMTGSVGDQY